MNKRDLGELYQFEQAVELYQDLLIKWLSQYKFKNWAKTETRQEPVTDAMKVDRAKDIAKLLNDPEKWRSHGRAIDMKTLQGEEIKLMIEDLEADPALCQVIVSHPEIFRAVEGLHESGGGNSSHSFTPRSISDMSQKQTVSPPNLKDVLKRNTRINFATVAAHERLEEKLKKLGVEIKPSYNLEPPLGMNPSGFYNRNS